MSGPGTAYEGAGTRVDLGCVREQPIGRPSQRTAAIAFQFGIPLFASRSTIVEKTQIRLAPGRITLLLGPSGSGKTSALSRIERQFAGGCAVQRISFPAHSAIVDRIAPWATLGEALSLLTGCGLGEAHLWVRPFSALSDGERSRARLARAVALHSRGGAAAPILCDEFCSLLHRRVAKAIAYGLRKMVTRRQLSVVLACSQEDILVDLQPDALVRLRGRCRCDVEERAVRPRKAFSLRRVLHIEPGYKRDYAAFASMHYRAADELGFVDKVFVMREGCSGEPVGIVVYSHAPLGLSLRNRATDDLFLGDPSRLNQSLRILRRLVIHPDVRGCGLGQYLVRQTLPRVGTEYVECLASMGEFNPVFQRAGMKRIGQYELCPKQKKALEALRAMDVNPNSREFPAQVCRRRRVREIVSQVVYRWYSATTAHGADRVQRQPPQLLAQTFRGLIGSRPVYYLWRRRAAK